VKILLASSEAAPFAKTGGLADVCGALPIELAKSGQQSAVIIPAYRHVYRAGIPIEPTGVSFEIPIGSKSVAGTYLKSRLPGSEVPIYFVQQDEYYDRPQLYTADGKDYKDNCERFVFFCRAALEAVRRLNLQTEVIHANDWQTGLIPALLKTEYRRDPAYENIATLMTIHNMAYPGIFWHWDMLLTGMDWKYFNWQQMEFFGNLNLLKTGLVFADRINTVSPRYAEEIQNPPLGSGLEGVLHQRRDLLSGIINGVDYRQWDPRTDQHLTANYGADDVQIGKPKCKAALQRELGLPESPSAPLIAFVGRLVEQKGIDLVAAVLREWVQQDGAQWVLLGTGDPQFHDLFTEIARRNSQKVAVRLEFSDTLAHKIEAGADIFLMPSRFEPCGLNQLYSLRYGAVPVVRATGGLADTITNVTDETLAAGTGTGFQFREYGALALSETLRRACNLYARPEEWRKIVLAGMRQDWSWTSSARQYIDLYQLTIAQRQRGSTR
jgi:starch synthase